MTTNSMLIPDLRFLHGLAAELIWGTVRQNWLEAGS
jgi:hypothetical protein